MDPFWPQILGGHSSTKNGVLDRQREHLLAVRKLFEGCGVLVVTLGLTEAWAADDSSVVPLPPGALSVNYAGSNYHFRNFGILELIEDMRAFIDNLKSVNPSIRIIVTVSPVPIAATYVPRNVVVSNTYTKSALRVVAEEMRRCMKHPLDSQAFKLKLMSTPNSR